MERSEQACRIVICDDQAAFRELIEAVLELEPELEVVGHAADGQQAIEVVGELEPDVLLLDVAMPVMDGLEALPHIRAVSPRTRVVMLTGVAAESVRQRALDAGAALFVEKGADPDAIVAHVKDACPGGG
jgi:DNA-binding NarL/FixJ family response regulator